MGMILLFRIILTSCKGLRVYAYKSERHTRALCSCSFEEDLTAILSHVNINKYQCLMWRRGVINDVQICCGVFRGQVWHCMGWVTFLNAHKGNNAIDSMSLLLIV